MSTTKKSPPPLRDATPEEMRALGHPLRLRILRLTLDEPMTNKQLAERLDRDPGTVLHHVRRLVATGFLAAEPIREGRRGAIERPYRATGKSWQVRMAPSADHTATVLEAVREEILEAGPDAAVTTVRLGVRLRPRDVRELRQRIRDLGDEFEGRDHPSGEPMGILAVAHRRRP
jgi:DNA-binding transcriptional ArsR family regulator